MTTHGGARRNAGQPSMRPVDIEEAKKLDHKIDYLELIENKDAEIQRLKQSRDILSDLLYKMEAKANNHEKLITELCDALENGLLTTDGVKEARIKYRRDQALLQRGREATR